MNVLTSYARANGEFYSRDGYLVRLDGERWKLNRDIDIPMFALAKLLSTEMFLSFRHVLAFYAQTSAPSHARNLFERYKHYVESTLGHPIFSVESLISYRSSLDAKLEWYLGTLRGLIRQWDRLGYSGIPKDALILLDKWTLKGNEKGYAVQSMCPDNGPLTDIEMEGITAATIRDYVGNRLSLLDACYALILTMTGRRPSQITGLRLCDLICRSDRYFISFPRAKQRNQSWRTSFKEFAIVEDLWLLLQQQAIQVQHAFARRLGREVPLDLVGELPLFPAMGALDARSDLRSQLVGDRLHAPSASVKESMDLVAKTTGVFSERTGGLLRLNPTRFRYTLGSNLAREGRGEFVIAEALDHSDTQNVGVYVRNIPEIVERIDKAVALQLAPIAQAFQGVLVVSERDAKRGDDPNSRISNGAVNLGTCGSYGFCGALAPVACYTCSHFQPWLDGPHEAVLEGLINERDKVMERTEDRKIASVNDRLILAVSDVVNRCISMKKEVARG
ncbi:Phage integrase family protein [Pseudomonas sp. LAMO17WK12:I10]|uniref:site-specific integrase n=1 Tax=unclassified Pseudomonas TaxID=196821 RepID=UPI000BC6F93C|nr:MULTISPECIES: site-specific integrase [unclassified Pseudomonas]PXX58237.1 phage integrase family protein [Pseudomonas sp. LAMO17WK12:I9]SNY47734.1 Phage integrase family protein [Pseudomonas sp. LAMO17WK12:I10]